MKARPFEFYRPTKLDEAVQLLSEMDDGAKLLAGGQSLLPLMAFRLARPTALIDITRIPDLDGIEVEENSLRIGALATHRKVELFQRLPIEFAAIHMGMKMLGHIAIRNRGTVGGSLAHCDPHAEWPALLMALDGSVDVVGVNGYRQISGTDFAEGWFTSTLSSDELIKTVKFPRNRNQEVLTFSSLREYSLRHGDFAIAGAVVSLSFLEGVVIKSNCVMFGPGSKAVKLFELEKFLSGLRLTQTELAEVKSLVASLLRNSEIYEHGSEMAPYLCAHLIPNLFADAISDVHAELLMMEER